MTAPYDPALSLAGVAPDLPTFRELARERRVIPVVRRLLADGETAVGLYRKLAGDRAGTFLLESAEHGRTWSRYSFVGARCAALLTESEGQVRWMGNPPVGVPRTGDPLSALRETLGALHTPRLPGLPPLTGGMVGFVGYDAVRRWERLPDTNPDELGLPELAMLLASDLAVLDHHDGTVLLIANAINYDATDERVDQAWEDAVRRLDAMTADLATPTPPTASTYDPGASVPVERRTGQADYAGGVRDCVEHIRAGDAFQIVLSQRFTAPCTADALDVYRILRVTNPSPYMYLLRLPAVGADGAPLPDEQGYAIVGSSPEALVKVEGDRALMHPIAGSRPRGATPEADAALAEELLADEKERAEHLMLVDLGRNDLGKVCVPGTVDVVEFMAVERFSHIMHIVSTVVGTLAEGVSAYDALAATFPAGTLSGAPKPSAMAIIDRLEPVRRGLYGGVVGYLDFAGDLDTAIAIRTAVLAGGTAYVQAGAGLVADSVPETEDAECGHKAAAVLRAVAQASSLRPC